MSSRLRHWIVPSLMFGSLMLLSGCATNWSDAQKAKLAAVKIIPAAVAKNAYQKPNAKISPGMANSIPAVTGGGLIPALIGSAIDASVTAKQQKKFEATNVQYFEALAAAMAEPPDKAVDLALRNALQTDAFFGSRLNDQGACTFSVDILSYGLANSPYSQKDDVQLRLTISAKFTLKLADGSTFFESILEGVASSAKHANEIVADPEFYEHGAKEAATSLADQLQVELEKKTKDTKKG